MFATLESSLREYEALFIQYLDVSHVVPIIASMLEMSFVICIILTFILTDRFFR